LGQLGHGDLEKRPQLTKVEYLKDKRVIKYSCGADYHYGGHSAVLTADAQTYVFGRLTPIVRISSLPVIVEEFVGKTVLSITCGENFNAVIVSPSHW
jgi:hypothetical protein